MKTTEHGIEESKDVENVYHMRLMALLQELVRERGYKGAARVLEIDQRTVAESAQTGVLSRRARNALERSLQEGVGSAAARQRERNDRLEERVTEVEGQVEALGKDARRRLAAVEGEIGALRRDGTQGTGAGHAGAGPSRQGSARGGEPVRRARAENLRQGPRCGVSTPTLRRGSLPTTTRRYSATPFR